MRNDSLAVEFVILSVAVTTVSNHFKYYQRTVQCFKNTETRKASLIRLAPALTEASLTFPAPLSLCSVLLNQGDAVVRVIYVRKTKQNKYILVSVQLQDLKCGQLVVLLVYHQKGERCRKKWQKMSE